ncbi:unannotated protein [freshwater metagenome]|uniref:Unannotated protein n=1 Tax=freshwater metagenome TaxID=449393 RepID=A0A6J6NNU9_9ZZZZ
MAHHRRQNEGKCAIDRRHSDHLSSSRKTLVALSGNHNRQRLVSAEDGHFFSDIVGRAANQAGRAHDDERLTREVDVLLIFGDIAGDALVAKLAEFDTHFLRGHGIRAVANHGPIPTLRGEPTSGLANLVTQPKYRDKRIRNLTQRREQLMPALRRTKTCRLTDRTCQQRTGSDLRVERLCRGNAHLNVAAVRGIQHAIGLVGEIAVATIHDANHACTATANKIDRAIGVGGCTALAYRHYERVAHVEAHTKATQFSSHHRVDIEAALGERCERRCHAAPGDGGSALADHKHATNGSGGQTLSDKRRKRSSPNDCAQHAVALDDLAAQCLAEALGGFGDFLEQEVRGRATIDVSRCYLGHNDVALCERQLRAAIRQAADAFEFASMCRR